MRRKLAPEQIANIRARYETTQVQVLASCEGICMKTLRKWRDEPPIKYSTMSNTHPTPEQAEWLKSNYRLYSNYHLAEKLKVPENRVTNWLRLLDLRKRKENRKAGSGVNPKKRINPGPERTIKRLKADHTNVSREQHIERILNMEL